MKETKEFKYYPAKKRFLDLTLSLVLILLTMPIMFIVGIVLFAQFKQFPIFIQERGITLKSFRYKILKFRTMRQSTIFGGENGLSDNIFYKSTPEGNLTRFSNWLRKTGLDELPQLFNVVSGKMSLIGPRPLMISDLELMQQKYPEYYAKRETFNCIPGVSGLWQIYGERDKGIKNLIELETAYAKHRTIIFDVKLLFATLPIVVLANHSDSMTNKLKISENKLFIQME